MLRSDGFSREQVGWATKVVAGGPWLLRLPVKGGNVKPMGPANLQPAG